MWVRMEGPHIRSYYARHRQYGISRIRIRISTLLERFDACGLVGKSCVFSRSTTGSTDAAVPRPRIRIASQWAFLGICAAEQCDAIHWHGIVPREVDLRPVRGSAHPLSLASPRLRLGPSRRLARCRSMICSARTTSACTRSRSSCPPAGMAVTRSRATWACSITSLQSSATRWSLCAGFKPTLRAAVASQPPGPAQRSCAHRAAGPCSA